MGSVVISMPSRPLGPAEEPPNEPEQKLQEDTPSDMQMLDEDDMKQLLKDLFISSSRNARQLELDEDADDGEDGDAADVADVTDDADNTLEYEAAVDSDSKVKASEEEVARFNNYIDAIYRRMNAALRAKMMDPMTLNLDDKQKKKANNKPRSLGKREADDEDEDEEEYDEKDDTPEVLEEDEMEHRAGKADKKKKKGAVARKNKKNKKKKGKKGDKKEEKSEKVNKKAEREAAKKEKQALREKKREERKKKKDEAERSLSKRQAYDDYVDYSKEEDAVLAED